MLITPLGEILILYDGKNVDYDYYVLPDKKGLVPNSDGFFRIPFEYTADRRRHKLTCKIAGSQYECDFDSGQNYEGVTLSKDRIVVELGVAGWFGDIDDRENIFDYSGDKGHGWISYLIEKETISQTFLFGVCWQTGVNIEDSQAFLGTDVYYDKSLLEDN